MNISPFFLDLDIKEIKLINSEFKKILENGTLILGKNTNLFEEKFSKFIGSKYSVAMNSGTSALETSLSIKLKCCRVSGKKNCDFSCKKKIAVPSNTNFATVAAIIKAGGEPIYLDMNPDYFSPGMNEVKKLFSKYKNIAGILTVHIGGIINPDIFKINEFCKNKKIFLIEDCAHAHGSSVNNKLAGSIGDIGCFSFFPTKVMTTMEGGMITTNSKEEYEVIKSMRNQGKRAGNYNSIHSDLGNSWRMSEISAFIGLIQLKKINQMLNKRKKIVNFLEKNLKSKKNIKFCDTSHMSSNSFYKVIIKINKLKNKKKIKERFKKENIFFGGEVYAIPCHKQPVFRFIKKNFINLDQTNYHCPRHLCPPIHSGFDKKKLIYLYEKMEQIFT